MKFSDLLSLNEDKNGMLDVNELTSLLPNTPKDVIEQFYVDHGANSEFQGQYSEIKVDKLVWDLVAFDYKTLCGLSVYPNFQEWVKTCEKKSLGVKETGDWSMIGHTEKVVEHWKMNKTWMRKPIVLFKHKKYYLVEGHSRYGCLGGLIKAKLIKEEKQHLVWVATNV